MSKQVELRWAESDDQAFRYSIYKTTRRAEVELFGWTPEQIEAFLSWQFDLRQKAYILQFPNAEYFIILFGNTSVGTFTVKRTANKIHLIDIAVRPQYRHRGIASHMINELKNVKNWGLGLFVKRISL